MNELLLVFLWANMLHPPICTECSKCFRILDRAGSSSYDNSPSSSCLHGRSWATGCFATVHVVEVTDEEMHLANVTPVKDIEHEIYEEKHLVKVK